MEKTDEITMMLNGARRGDRNSADKLVRAVYSQLHIIAKRYMASEQPGHTLQPTAVINEAFMRLFEQGAPGEGLVQRNAIDWQSRAHFLGVAAIQMRRVLVDHARQKGAVKRKFGRKFSLDDIELGSPISPSNGDIESLDQLLNSLATKDPDAAKVVELKFFGGLQNEEVAEVMHTNVAKVRRDWAFARSWLRQRLENSPGETRSKKFDSAGGKSPLIQ